MFIDLNRVLRIVSTAATRFHHSYERTDAGEWICKATVYDGIRSRTVWSDPMGTMSQARERAYLTLLNILMGPRGT